MANVTVDETEFLNYRGVSQAVEGILANPEARKMLLRARKLADPKASIPEIDAAEPVNTELAAIKQQLAADAAARAEERAEREQEKRMAAAEKSFFAQKARLKDAGWRDEGIEAIIAHATERGIGDLEVAAAHWEKLHPPSEPVQPNGSGSWNFMTENAPDDTFVKAMIESRGEDESALNSEINAALKEFRGQTGARR